MSKGILFYDATCPLCKAFRGAIQSYIGDAIEYKPIEANAKTFRYIGTDGTVYQGKDALRRLMVEQPKIAPALNVLPEKWKVQVVNAGVQAATMIRSAMSKLQESIQNGQLPKGGGCGCGKNK